MGFREAIDASGWDAKRRQAADDLLDEMRGVLSWGPPGGPYASRIFHNLDADEAVPDVPEADSPVSRLELLDDLLSSGPPHGDALKLHLKGFCRHHKKEGPPDPLAKDRVVGRVWQLDALARHSGDDSAASFGGKALVRETIEQEGLLLDVIAYSESHDDATAGFLGAAAYLELGYAYAEGGKEKLSEQAYAKGLELLEDVPEGIVDKAGEVEGRRPLSVERLTLLVEAARNTDD